MKKDKLTPTFIIADGVLKNMFEGKNKGKAGDLLKKLKSMHNSGMDIKVLTPLSSFLRAIFLSDSKVHIGKVQKVLSFLHVVPGFSDFKNKDEVKREIIRFAHLMSGGKNEKSTV